MNTDQKVPKIGVVGYFISEHEDFGGRVRGIPGQAFALFGYDMIMAVYKAGAIPVPLPVVSKDLIARQIEHVDGLIFSGGEDIDPRFYGESIRATAHRIDPVRDRYEMDLMAAALEAGTPVFCICRGMQLLNVFCGGTLHSDIDEVTEQPLKHWETKEPWNSVHSVEVAAGHFAQQVLGDSKLEVNSIHHQSIDRLGDGLEVIARSPDGIVEAVAMKDRDNVLAVQWHPEMIAKFSEEGLRPFHWLIEKAKRQ